MKQLQTVEEIDIAIEKLIAELKLLNYSKLAAILNHRMHQVAWTTRAELFEELQAVLSRALVSDTERLNETQKSHVMNLLQAIKKVL